VTKPIPGLSPGKVSLGVTPTLSVKRYFTTVCWLSLWF
jgi:hypothetical protein